MASAKEKRIKALQATYQATLAGLSNGQKYLEMTQDLGDALGSIASSSPAHSNNLFIKLRIAPPPPALIHTDTALEAIEALARVVYDQAATFRAADKTAKSGADNLLSMDNSGFNGYRSWPMSLGDADSAKKVELALQLSTSKFAQEVTKSGINYINIIRNPNPAKLAANRETLAQATEAGFFDAKTLVTMFKGAQDIGDHRTIVTIGRHLTYVIPANANDARLVTLHDILSSMTDADITRIAADHTAKIPKPSGVIDYVNPPVTPSYDEKREAYYTTRKLLSEWNKASQARPNYFAQPPAGAVGATAGAGVAGAPALTAEDLAAAVAAGQKRFQTETDPSGVDFADAIRTFERQFLPWENWLSREDRTAVIRSRLMAQAVVTKVGGGAAKGFLKLLEMAGKGAGLG